MSSIHEKRREQNRLAKQRQRQRLVDEGCRKIEIIVPASSADEIEELRHKQKGPIETFYLRALVTGAKFLANSGQPKHKKTR